MTRFFGRLFVLSALAFALSGCGDGSADEVAKNMQPLPANLCLEPDMLAWTPPEEVDPLSQECAQCDKGGTYLFERRVKIVRTANGAEEDGLLAIAESLRPTCDGSDPCGACAHEAGEVDRWKPDTASGAHPAARWWLQWQLKSQGFDPKTGGWYADAKAGCPDSVTPSECKAGSYYVSVGYDASIKPFADGGHGMKSDETAFAGSFDALPTSGWVATIRMTNDVMLWPEAGEGSVTTILVVFDAQGNVVFVTYGSGGWSA
jgi:hypothetical protein